MPLYDYDCANCGQRFEVLRGVHADEPTECQLCGGGPIKKAASGTKAGGRPGPRVAITRTRQTKKKP